MYENNEKVLNVTSIEELLKSKQGEIVELPSFSNDVPFVARLKRPSLMAMVKSGKIPNELLEEANKLFTGGPGAVVSSNVDKNMMDKLFSILENICEEAFVEPTYEQLKQNGIELTDEQQLFVFDYTQRGVESLKSFRK